MSRSIKSGRIIVINSVLMFFFIAVLIAQNIFFLEKTNSSLSLIDSKYNRKLDVIMRLSKIVRERSLCMVSMHYSQDIWEQDRIFTEFHKLKLPFIELKDELMKLGLQDDEKILFEQALSIIRITEPLQNDIVDRIHSGGDDKIHYDISEKDLPLENKLLGIFDRLIEVTRNNVDAARNQAKEQYKESVNLVIVIAAFVFFIILILVRKSLFQIKKIETGLIYEAESLSWDATHDALTNVYNRRWLEHKFKTLQNNEQAQLKKHSLLYIDLDEFKPVNDNYGHVFGDKFLCGVTRELEQCIRQNDTLARLGGDEFAILLEHCDTKKAIEIATCLCDRVAKYNLPGENENVHIVGCSIGINEFSVSAIASFDELLKQTDTACYDAKRHGKNTYRVVS